MKKRNIKYFKKKQASSFLNRCPATGGTCLNPLCLIGCIER